MSSLLRISRRPGAVEATAPSTMDMIERVLKAIAGHPALDGILLVIFGQFVKGTHQPASSYVDTNPAGGTALPGTGALNPRGVVVNVRYLHVIPENVGLDLPLWKVDTAALQAAATGTGEMVAGVIASVISGVAVPIIDVRALGQDVMGKINVIVGDTTPSTPKTSTTSSGTVVLLSFGDVLTIAGVLLLIGPALGGAASFVKGLI